MVVALLLLITGPVVEGKGVTNTYLSHVLPKTCCHVALFYESTLLPSSHFEEVHKCPEWSNASGLFYTKC